jgi:glycosyltransferase involved in cell wall biosynthesis
LASIFSKLYKFQIEKIIMAKLIIDVTQLIHWPGELTGIPRVMNELALRYSRDSDVAFVVWNKQNKTCYAVDIEATLSSRGEGIHYLNDSSSALGHKTKDLVKAAVQNKTLSHLPGKRTIRKLAGGRLARTSVQPSKGDVLLVLWGEMEETFEDYLINAHDAGVKLVQIVYDLLPLVTPQYSGHSTKPMEKYNRAVLPICELVLAISEHTKKDLALWLKQQKLAVPRTETFRLGDDFKQAQPVRPQTEEFISNIKDKDFILCVGTVEVRKNHTLLYYVYKLARQRHLALPKLAIVGRRGWKTEDIYEIITSDPETKSDLIFLHGLTDEELAWMYQNCLFSVYPSFYEGWGLPVAESLARGVPCIASNTSSIPEIAGGLIDYFSPASTDECLRAIESLLDPAKLAKAKKRASSYKPASWDQTFELVDKFIKEIK